MSAVFTRPPVTFEEGGVGRSGRPYQCPVCDLDSVSLPEKEDLDLGVVLLFLSDLLLLSLLN